MKYIQFENTFPRIAGEERLVETIIINAEKVISVTADRGGEIWICYDEKGLCSKRLVKIDQPLELMNRISITLTGNEPLTYINCDSYRNKEGE